MRFRSLPFPLLFFAIGISTTREDEAAGIAVGVDSRYLAQGRDDSDDHALAFTEITWEGGPLSFGVWHASHLGSEDGNHETDLSAAYEFSAGEWEGYLGYTRLEFRSDGESAFDNEYSFGFARPIVYACNGRFDFVYSAEAGGKGSFAILGLDRAFELSSKSSLGVSTAIAFDYGYRTSDHDGLNNWELAIEYSYAFNEAGRLTAYAMQSIGLEDLKREIADDPSINDGKRNQTLVGLAFAYSF